MGRPSVECPRCHRPDAEADGVLVYCVYCGIFGHPGLGESSGFLRDALDRATASIIADIEARHP